MKKQTKNNVISLRMPDEWITWAHKQAKMRKIGVTNIYQKWILEGSQNDPQSK
jgi:hypothetical protein